MGWTGQWSTFRNSFLCLVAVLVARKAYYAEYAMYQVRACRNQVSQEAIVSSEAFDQLIAELRKRQKPAALLFLNQYALNMTYNFLCNTVELEDVHDRFVFITLDDTARDSLKKLWPNVAQFYWPTQCLTVSMDFLGNATVLLHFLHYSTIWTSTTEINFISNFHVKFQLNAGIAI